MMKPLKIALIVHGRFDAFDLARAFIERGHDLTLLTNYPKWVVKKFGIESRYVKSFWVHGVLSRMAQFFCAHFNLSYPDFFFHPWFGRWAARELIKTTWDIIDTWSGVSEEILEKINSEKTLIFLVRGSSHIDTQKRILKEEEKRTEKKIESPSNWMMIREKREYKSAQHIRVLSSYAWQSFVNEGIPKEKIELIPSAVPIENFRANIEDVERRCERINDGKPLRILYVGSLLYRKGIKDLVEIIQEVDSKRFKFRLVGPSAKECRKILQGIKKIAWVDKKKPQCDLPKVYAWADLFIFPTLEDGFPAVLAQAYANALPILTTPNCSGPDLIQDGKTGWILPVRSPQVFSEKLKWCDLHREELSEMVKRICKKQCVRTWQQVAEDFEKFYFEKIIKNKKTNEMD